MIDLLLLTLPGGLLLAWILYRFWRAITHERRACLGYRRRPSRRKS